MKWRDLQGQAASAIRASTSLAGVMVIEDDGTIEQAAEKQLREIGTVIVVGMPDDFQASDHGPKASVGDVRIVVEVIQNPTRNAARPVRRNLVEDLGEVTLAMIYSPGEFGQVGFRLDGFTMVANEPGLIVYAVTFSRRCTLSKA